VTRIVLGDEELETPVEADRRLGDCVELLARARGPEVVKGRKVIAARVDGRLADLAVPVGEPAEVELITTDTEAGREILRHSTAHVMAQAVLELWPGAYFAIGPPIENGFYYDFELPDGGRFSDEDLERIEAKMRAIVAENQPFQREEHPVEEGLTLFADQPFKREIIEKVAAQDSDSTISAYRNTDRFVDLCRGPHVPSTRSLGHFKLLRVSGAYWRGDETRPQLQRIYGTAFESREKLEEHLHRLAEAERRDHRRLGLELDLFHFPPEIGSGLPVFHPKGAIIRRVMEEYSRRVHENADYLPVWTPHLVKSKLFEISGHLGWYSAGMFPAMELEGSAYYPKPMSCPLHILVYQSAARSYRELPMRLFELATVYRYERSGVLHGLARVRGLTQDDSHIFCTREQLPGELASLLAFILEVLSTFGLTEFDAELSTRPEKYVGELAEWEEATSALESALVASGIPYRVAEGEGAFYAPKLDVHLRDAIGRRWQVSTLQVDLQMPDRFDLSYIGSDNQRHRPYMIHRALFGSVERFFAILLEHYAGSLPAWLSPVQVSVLPVRQDHEAYAESVRKAVRQAGFRVESRPADEPLGARIRVAKTQRVPYVLVVGDEDVDAGTAGVNERGEARPRRGVQLPDFLAELEAKARPPA
jgi:threonyl-tRNA synthetase